MPRHVPAHFEQIDVASIRRTPADAGIVRERARAVPATSQRSGMAKAGQHGESR